NTRHTSQVVKRFLMLYSDIFNFLLYYYQKAGLLLFPPRDRQSMQLILKLSQATIPPPTPRIGLRGISCPPLNTVRLSALFLITGVKQLNWKLHDGISVLLIKIRFS